MTPSQRKATSGIHLRNGVLKKRFSTLTSSHLTCLKIISNGVSVLHNNYSEASIINIISTLF